MFLKISNNETIPENRFVKIANVLPPRGSSILLGALIVRLHGN
jgi:hypothetical protein